MLYSLEREYFELHQSIDDALKHTAERHTNDDA
jgi:hypothetical protein